MIVKNGAAFLEQCLTSVHSIVSEIIIIDTGSTDNTVVIAQKFNASVEHFDWTDDFSAARNYSIRKAAGDWILVMDHDEELAPESQKQLIPLLKRSDKDLYFINIISHKNSNGFKTNFINSLPRLFINHLGIKFEGKIHEQVLPSAERIGARIGQSDIILYHHGYNLGTDEQHRKLNRNLNLLKKEVLENPENAFAHFHLGETYSLLNDHKQAIEAYKKALNSENLPSYLKPVAFQNYGNALFKTEDFFQAIEQCTKAIELKNDLLMAYLIISLIYNKLNQPRNVILYLKKLIALIEHKKINQSLMFEAIPDLTFVYTILGHNYVKLGKVYRAIISYKHAVQLGSQFYDTYMSFADLIFKQKQFQHALKNYQQAYLLGERDNSIYLKLMQCYFELGNTSKAIEMIMPLIISKKSFWVDKRYQSIVKMAQHKIMIKGS